MLILTALATAVLTLPPSNAALTAGTPPEVRVPFGCGLTFPVSQAHDTGSHLQNDVWAWDFRMPEGTPIVAAMDGTVRLARGDSAIGGCGAEFAPYANYVVVRHAGGLETQYLHFSSVVVRAGDKVKAGDLLGYSGKTGWACGAHLHFKMAREEGSGWNNPSVPARIVGYGDPQAETLISAPSCSQPQPPVLFAEKAPPPAPVAGDVQNASTTTAPGAAASTKAVETGTGAGSKPAPVPTTPAPNSAPAQASKVQST